MKVVLHDDSRLGIPSSSKMNMIFACEGCLEMQAIAEQQKHRPPESGPDAEYGQLIHAHVESGDVSELNENDADTVSSIRAREEELVADWLASTGHNMTHVTVHRELRMWVPNCYSGQVDTLAINEEIKAGFVLDTKAGRKPVPQPSENWQLRSLAVAAHLQFGIAPIRTAIVQPFAERQPVSEYSASHIAVALDRIKERLALARIPGRPRTPGNHCEWCSAKHICVEFRSYTSFAVQCQSLQWDLATPDFKFRFWQALQMAKWLIKHSEPMFHAQLKAEPNSIPGLSKKPDSEVRSISDCAKAFLAMNETSGGRITPERFLQDCSISIETLKRMYRDNCPPELSFDRFLDDQDFVLKSPRNGKIVTDAAN